MSYESYSVLDKGAPLKQVREVVKLLGYVKASDWVSAEDRTDCMMWFESKNYKSWVGVEIDIYFKDKQVTVYTRSRSGRSHWDILHQNKTLKMLRDLFGGYFETDAGKNKYWHPEEAPPSEISSGCYLARWRFNNALIKPRIYFKQRKLEGQNANSLPTGIGLLDEMNPRLFSNNLILPYLVAAWEDFFKSTFIVLLKCSENRVTVLKNLKLSYLKLEEIAAGSRGVEDAVAESLSFQRPTKIADSFKLVDKKLDFAGIMKKPYRRRKKSLFDSIDECINIRNQFVHSGDMNVELSDRKIRTIISDFEEAVDRVYDELGKVYGFTPIRDY